MNSFKLNLLETIYLPTKLEEANSIVISENGCICITSQTCLLIYEIIPRKENISPTITTMKYLLSPRPYVLSLNLDIDAKNVLDYSNRFELHEMVLNSKLSNEVSDSIVKYSPRFLKATWSLPCMEKSLDSLLGVLTFDGTFFIYLKDYDCLFSTNFVPYNVTEKYIEILRYNWCTTESLSQQELLKEFKQRYNDVAVSAFSWNNYVSNDSILLILSHMNGVLSFWVIKFEDNAKLSIKFLKTYKTSFLYINSILCYQVSQTESLVLIGDADGNASGIKLSHNDKNEIERKFECKLYNKNDKDKINNIHMVNNSNGYVILLVKRTVIIFIYMTKQGVIVENYQMEIGNVMIKDIIFGSDNKMLVLTANGVTKEIVLHCTPSSMDVKWRFIYLDINWYPKMPLGMVASKNNALYFLLNFYCKPKDMKVSRYDYELLMFYNSKNPLEVLIENPQRSLTNYWDYLELLRCVTILNKSVEHEKLLTETNYDNYDFYKLKLILWISKVCELVSEHYSKYIPIKSYEEIYAVMHFKLILRRIEYLISDGHTNGYSNFHKQNLLILFNYVKQTVSEDSIKSLDLSDSFRNKLLQVTQRIRNLNFNDCKPDDCFGCDGRVDDVTCMPPHFDSRCVLSFLPIGGFPKFKCNVCGCVLHERIASEVKVVVCPFCDLPVKIRRNTINVEDCVKIKTEIL